MLKFQRNFKRVYSNKKEFHIEKIEKIMQLEEYVDIPGNHIAMEIILNNSIQSILKQNPKFCAIVLV